MARAHAAPAPCGPAGSFNLVGLRWRGDAVASLSRAGATAPAGWSRWVDVPVEPEHGPDAGNGASPRRAAAAPTRLGGRGGRRCSTACAATARVRDLRLHFVNTDGTATSPRGSARAAAPRASIARPIGAVRPASPAIVPREDWGAAKCPPRATPAYGEVKLAFVHHTVSANDYGPEDSAAMVLGICRYHRNSNGWNDIGYNFLVDRYGTIFEGRAGGIDEAVVGAQAQGYNSQSTGIASLGTFSTAGPDARRARRARAPPELEARACTAFRRPGTVAGGLGRRIAEPLPRRLAAVTFERISGHRDGDATACPGDGLYAQLPQLRAMVTARPAPARRVDLAAARCAAASPTARRRCCRRGSRARPARRSRARPVDVQMLGRLGHLDDPIQTLEHRLRRRRPDDACGSPSTARCERASRASPALLPSQLDAGRDRRAPAGHRALGARRRRRLRRAAGARSAARCARASATALLLVEAAPAGRLAAGRRGAPCSCAAGACGRRFRFARSRRATGCGSRCRATRATWRRARADRDHGPLIGG